MSRGGPRAATTRWCHRAILRIVASFARLAVEIAADFRFHHDLLLPETAIYVAPHRSMFDVPLGIHTFRRLGVAPLLVVSQQHLGALRLPIRDWDALNVLPISRDAHGRARMLEVGRDALSAGRSVAIMPEGRVIRNDRANGANVRSGAAELAVGSGKPVVTLGSAGVEELWQRGKPSTFASLRRRTIVGIAHGVVAPCSDVGEMRQAITESLAAAEHRAHRILERTARTA
ncbi:MAG: 1-acyl-sn-glycerol-3-phosphate acyltransferase [Solirubrobacteraceae bacterium]|nr:1-acyl-sn-glycerol-3-phosphate acyltransferase [Solirubrobacteraceae bacterium]